MNESDWHCRIKSVRLKGGRFKLLVPETVKNFGAGTMVTLEMGSMVISKGHTVMRVSE